MSSLIAGIDVASLQKRVLSARLPAAENYRTYYGRSLDLGRIESAILNADCGNMIALADLEGESLSIDPHLSGVVGKRLGQILGLDWDLTPAQVDGDDKKWAEQITDATRRAYQAIPEFSQRLYDLAWALYDGRASHEIHWERVTGVGLHWSPQQLAWIHPRRLSFGASRELRIVDTWRTVGGFESEGNGVGIDDYPGKFLQLMPRLFRDYPEREGLAPRTLYWSFFKRFSWRHRMTLLELFGIPWRIVKSQKGATVNREAFDEARDAAENLGAETTATFGSGIDLDVVFPGENSGQLFKMTAEEVDAQMSKLVLWQTGTTDAVANRAETIVHKSEQDLIVLNDAAMISSCVQSGLTVPFVTLNWGAEAAARLAPKFQLRAQPARDRAKELERIDKTISIGLPVAVSELREVSGLRAPLPDEPYITAEGGAAAMRYRIVDPAAQADVPDEQVVAAAAEVDLGVEGNEVIVRVNEARAGKGLGPLLRPDGSHDPDGDLYVAELKAKIQNSGAGGLPSTSSGGSPAPSSPAPDAAPAPDDSDHDDEAEETELGNAAHSHLVKQLRAYGDAPEPTYGTEDEFAALAGLTTEDEPEDDEPATMAADHRTPEEKLVERATREGARITGSMAGEFVAAVPAEGDISKAWKAVGRAATRVSTSRLAKHVERVLVRGVMLGATEADWEALHEGVVPLPDFGGAGVAQLPAKAAEGATAAVQESVAGRVGEVFVRKPFEAAVRDFAARKVLTKPAFARLTGAAKRKAFTIADLARKGMVDTAHSELTRAIREGIDLREFRARLTERFTAAGWTPIKPSRVELVFRNAVMSSEANGRHAQMTQPHVLAARPYWQILGVDDARTRPTHAAAHRKVLAADDPFWERIGGGPPMGHQCRCRVTSRSEADLERLGLTESKGDEAWAKALPDEGWNS